MRITTRINKERSSSFKKDLASLKLNDTIEAEGPMGSFTMADLNQHYIFIAGGIGITPFRSIIVQLAHDQKPINITLLYANRNNEIVFKDELDQIAQKNPSFQIHYIIDPQKIDLQALTPYSNSPYSPTFYLSGPEPMVQGIEKLLSEQLQVPTERIKTDYFPGYSGI